MAYSPKRAPGITQNTRRAEAEQVGAKLPTVSARVVKQVHLGTHFDLTGDSPASYAATLGTAPAATDFSPRVPTRAEIRSRLRADSVSLGSDKSALPPRPAPAERLEPRQMSRAEVRAKLTEGHIRFDPPASAGSSAPSAASTPRGDGGSSASAAFSSSSSASVPRLEPVAHPTPFGRTGNHRHLASTFAIHEMEPSVKERTWAAERARMLAGPIPAGPPGPRAGEVAQVCREKKQDLLTSHFRLG